MGKITWMLLVPLVPSILLFVVFPDQTFRYSPVQESPGVSATGAVGLYFALIILSMKYLKTDRLDAKTRQRAKMLGDWTLTAHPINQVVKNQHPSTSGNLTFTLDPETQRLALNGWTVDQRGEKLHFATDKVFVDDDKLTYLVGIQAGAGDHRRWLVELDLPATKSFRSLHGGYHEVEGDAAGTLDIEHRKKRMALAQVLTVASLPAALATIGLLWLSGWLSSHMGH